MPPALFSPLSIGSVTARNRIWVSPMCQYSVLDEDGVPGDWQLAHLGSMAAGGAGLVVAEATAIRPDGRISPRDTGLWNDRQEQEWSRITRLIRAQGALAGIQLAHAGRKASTYPLWGSERQRGTVPASEGGWETVAPSAVAYDGLADPRALTDPEIEELIEQFAESAVRAERAGFDVIEVHAAHGYLLHQFLSPRSNHRDDRWGGPLEHRARLTVEVVRRMRERTALPIMVRFSATDWVDDGWDLEQTIIAAELVRAAGADLIDVSTGGNVPARIPTGPGYQVRFAAELKARTGIPTAAVGLITDARHAAEIVESGQADAVMLGREFLRDPHTALRFARELQVDDALVRDWCAPQHRRGYL